jgi:multimeric flavodoxin WrbA
MNVSGTTVSVYSVCASLMMVCPRGAASIVRRAREGIENMKGVEVERVKLTDYLSMSPCMSCWNCARNEEHMCTLDDSMGARHE